MTNDDRGLDGLFQSYRDACPDVEPGAGFMPGIWRRIETRHSFGFVFRRLGRTFMTASAALFVLLLVLNLISAPQVQVFEPTYEDALMADQSVERTDYTETIRSIQVRDEAPYAIQH